MLKEISREKFTTRPKITTIPVGIYISKLTIETLEQGVKYVQN